MLLEWPSTLLQLTASYVPMHCEKCKIAGCEEKNPDMTLLTRNRIHTECVCCQAKCQGCKHMSICPKCAHSCQLPQCKKKVLCLNCATECSLCDKWLCNDHEIFSEQCLSCNVIVCANCIRGCETCKVRKCTNCHNTRKCKHCFARVCDKETCAPKPFHSRHCKSYRELGECHIETCRECEYTCFVCQFHGSCEQCIRICKVCEKHVCETCFIVWNCDLCSSEPRFSDDVVCFTCASSLHKDENIGNIFKNTGCSTCSEMGVSSREACEQCWKRSHAKLSNHDKGTNKRQRIN